jgi:hypothetical protein
LYIASVELINALQMPPGAKSTDPIDLACESIEKRDNTTESPIGVFDPELSSPQKEIENEVLEKGRNHPRSTDDESTELKEMSKSYDNTEFTKIINNTADTNENNASLVRIKSEQNLQDDKKKTKLEKEDAKPESFQKENKDKSYNSKNFFTENFDDQEMEDAIKKIKNIGKDKYLIIR